MTRTIARIVVGAGAAAICAVVAGFLLYAAGGSALRLEFDTDAPRIVSGIYPSELDAASRLTFAWTGGAVDIRLAGLDRRIPWTLRLRARGGRGSANPAIRVLCDGLPVATLRTTDDFSDLDATLPAQPGRPAGAVVTLEVSETFVPGPSDRRALGIMLDSLTLTPSGMARPPRNALASAAAAAAWLGAGVAVVTATTGATLAAGAIVGPAVAVVLLRGFAAYMPFPHTAVALARATALALAAGWLLLLAMRRTAPPSNAARAAAAFSAIAFFLKLAVLLSPLTPIGDALFQAHRFQWVLSGRLLFTSIAPGGYQFPYAPGLYVFSALFSPLVHRGTADMALLRIVCAAADATAALLLYRVAAGAWSRRAALLAVVLYQCTPLDFSVLTTGNLTNAFAQSVAVFAFALMALPIEWRRPGRIALLALALAAAYLSHTSTLAILFASTVAICVLMWVRGGSTRIAAGPIAVATLAAACLAVIAYYGWFFDTYQHEFARIGHEVATGAPAPGHRTITDRLLGVPYSLRINLGWPLLVLAVAGFCTRAWRLADALSLTATGWLAACAAFLVIGIVTPVDMRYYLASIPAIAVLGGAGAAWAWEKRGVFRLASAALLAWCVLNAFTPWWSAIA